MEHLGTDVLPGCRLWNLHFSNDITLSLIHILDGLVISKTEVLLYTVLALVGFILSKDGKLLLTDTKTRLEARRCV